MPIQSGNFACGRDDTCPSRFVWAGLERAVADYLRGITLQDVLERESDAAMYVI